MEEETVAKWTQFMDMHSGGGLKEPPYKYIYIEAPEAEARTVFYARFDHSPNRVSCTCCGQDYSVEEAASLDKATAYDRKPSQTVEEYCTRDDVLVIEASGIKNDERGGEVPIEGYVWL